MLLELFCVTSKAVFLTVVAYLVLGYAHTASKMGQFDPRAYSPDHCVILLPSFWV